MAIPIPDLVRYSIKALSEKRLRATLTIIGIAIGPLALVMMTSVVEGYGDYIEEELMTLGQNTVVLMPNAGYELGENDLDYLRSIDGVLAADPFYLTQAYINTPEGRKQVYVYAVDRDILFKAVGGLEIMEGDYPGPNDLTYACIGYRVAFNDKGERVFELGDAITLTITEIKQGGEVEIRRASVRVKGVFAEYGGAMFISPDQSIFLPLEAGRTIIRLKTWSGILVVVKSPDLVKTVTQELREAYSGKADVISFQQIAEVVGSVTGAINFITFATSLSAFAVAVAGTAATMITAVIERTREIGVLKALGFTDGEVTAMILAESLLMSLIGAVMGIALGVAGAHALSSSGLRIGAAENSIVIYAPPKLTIVGVLRALIITLFVGVVGGVFPAYRAAKIPPAVALRYE